MDYVKESTVAKIDRARIQFQETEVIDACANCNARPGQLHAYGCPSEECPDCSDAVLHCHCMSLSPLDGLRIERAIVANITAAELEALLVKGLNNPGESYYECGAQSWITKKYNDNNSTQRATMISFAEAMGFERTGDDFLITPGGLADLIAISAFKKYSVAGELRIETRFPGWREQAMGLEQ